MENSKEVKEVIVKDAKVVVKSNFPIAETIREVGKSKMIAEGSGNWFRLVERIGKKENIIFTDGGTTFKKFKQDCVKYLPKSKKN
ncbi:hypothetical protein [Flavicella sediminum]|uniref:hypothetical protein n=1 Tax=Flavicella sediminum TaxID=2585141 RepID=UPI00111EE09C|nr:hypothetical protein [Flavicella sediminum]